MSTARRKEMRQPLVLPATIYAQDGRPVCDCRTWDWAEHGARLQVAAPLDLPNAFNLTLSGDESRKCEVVWRSEGYVGVLFQPD